MELIFKYGDATVKATTHPPIGYHPVAWADVRVNERWERFYWPSPATKPTDEIGYMAECITRIKGNG